MIRTMAWYHADRPITDDELTEVSEAIHEQRDEIRDYLAGEGVNMSTWNDDTDTLVRGADRDAANSD